MKRDPQITVKEMVKRTGRTIDHVKRAAALLRKDTNALNQWAVTTLDDYDFIKNYSKKNPSSNNDVPSRKKIPCEKRNENDDK